MQIETHNGHEGVHQALGELLRSAQRLAAVRALDILDTPAEDAFDDLTRLASTLLSSPASFLAIVDAERDFYKSQIGFPEQLALARELGGCTTFCPDAIGRLEPLAIADTIASMKGLVDDLLATHAIETPATRRRELLSVQKLLTDAHGAMATVASRAGISVTIECADDIEVSADYARLLRVVCNLLGNCVKYCQAASSVALRAERAGGCVSITIADSGPGMSAQEQQHAFERGWQGREGIARQDGAGLGLSIVRSLVEHNEGTVSLVSEQGVGTTVQIELPSAIQ